MFERILVPLDGSSLAELALPLAAEMARRFEASVTLTRVVLPPHVVSHTAGAAYASLLTGLREVALDEASAYLQGQAASLQAQGVAAGIHLVDGEPVADMILEVAEAIAADLVVMSTHGRSGVSRWVFGSVADRLLRSARMPILLVRAAPDAT